MNKLYSDCVEIGVGTTIALQQLTRTPEEVFTLTVTKTTDGKTFEPQRILVTYPVLMELGKMITEWQEKTKERVAKFSASLKTKPLEKSTIDE
jgi:hypothetical protein